MHEYELMYILHPRLTVDEATDAIERVSALISDRGGEQITGENWSRRRLAYPIEHNFEGTYVLTTWRLAPTVTASVETALRISEDVIRHLLIRGIIPYDGPPAQDDRARASRSAAGDSPEAAEESANDDGPADVASDADAGEAAPVAVAVAVAAVADGEAEPAAPVADGAGGSDEVAEAEVSVATGDAGSDD
ncbi:MAG: 30S ribosomal protein S6 [Chloroflexi bacterium]|nr:30S ribosomal protein S6 [Chloroflexota bacterium]